MSFLSPILWLRFLDRLLYFVHYPFLPLIVIGVLALRRRFGSGGSAPVLQLCGILIALNLGVRLFMFFIGLGVNSRHFFLAETAGVLFAGIGCVGVVDWLDSRRARVRPGRARTGSVLVLVLIAAISLPKTLKVHNDKRWLIGMGLAIRQHTVSGRPVIWMARPDTRLAYFADGALVRRTEGLREPDCNRALALAENSGSLFLVTQSAPAVVRRGVAGFARDGVSAPVIQLLHREHYDDGDYYLFRVHPRTIAREVRRLNACLRRLERQAAGGA